MRLLQLGQRSMESTQIFPPNSLSEQKFLFGVFVVIRKENFVMQAAVDRVMHAYGMPVNLTLEEERAARQKVMAFLAQSKTDDENKLAVEGMKFLRGGIVRHRNTGAA